MWVQLFSIKGPEYTSYWLLWKMKELEKREVYYEWKSGEVQVIVATCAFGLGINKTNIRFAIGNGLPPEEGGSDTSAIKIYKS